MVAEDHMHPRVAFLVAVDGVQAPGAVGGKVVATVSRKIKIERPSQHAFVGRHPFNSLPGRKHDCLFRDTSLRRPKSLGTNSEQRLVRLQSALDLETGVFRTAEAPRREAQAGAGLRADIGVAEQWQNRMIVRSGRKLD